MFLVSIFFLCGIFFLTALGSSFRHIPKQNFTKLLQNLGNRFFYRKFHSYFFPTYEYEGLFFAIVCAKNLARFFFATSALMFLLATSMMTITSSGGIYGTDFSWFWLFLGFFAFFLSSFLFGDFLARIFGTRRPEIAMRLCAPLSSIFLFVSFPLTYIFLRLGQIFSGNFYFDYFHEPEHQVKQEIIDIVQRAEFTSEMDIHDKKLIHSVLAFRSLISREVMVPRVDLFSLSADVTIKDAAKLLENEGYSRTPVYRNTVDNIVGVLMYKDILAKYREYEEKNNNSAILNAPIETIQKPVLYTPETKKISQLLQEFRKKQVHLAIVVDEYGGTEGIVTIEDILEQIVGDISDEYDEAEPLFIPQNDGSWIVDPRMSILDAEEQLGISIPESGDYDSIGGYIFHCAGAIPSKGFVIHRDEFEIEILRSNERVVEKVRIRPLNS